MRKTTFFYIALCCITLISCTGNEPQAHTSIIGSWHCAESSAYGSRNYLVDIDRKRTDTTQYLMSNFYNQDVNEFILAHLSGKTLTITQQQILALTVKSGTGLVSNDFKRIDFDYNMYDWSSEINVHAIYTR